MSETALACVVDTSAVLALLWEEAGADVVAEAIERAGMSAVNWSELVAVMTERGLPDEAIRNSLSPCPSRPSFRLTATTQRPPDA